MQISPIMKSIWLKILLGNIRHLRKHNSQGIDIDYESLVMDEKII